NVHNVMPSRFAGAISISSSQIKATSNNKSNDNASGGGANDEPADDSTNSEAPTPEPTLETPLETPRIVITSAADPNQPTVSPAPVVHLADERGALLIDYPH